MPPRKARPGRPPKRAHPTQTVGPCAEAKSGCQIGDLFRLLGKAHMMDILHVVIHEEPAPKRFMDIQKRLSLSPNTLSDRLKELVEAGLLTRTAYNEIPPRVDYDATKKAHDLRPVFGSLYEWAREHDLKPEAAAPETATA